MGVDAICEVDMGVFRLSTEEVRVFNIGVLGIGTLGMSVLGLIDCVRLTDWTGVTDCSSRTDKLFVSKLTSFMAEPVCSLPVKNPYE